MKSQEINIIVLGGFNNKYNLRLAKSNLIYSK